jgi:transposase
LLFMDEKTGEYEERQLNHSDGEAEKFCRELKQRGVSVRVGMEATGYSRWFERLLAELGFELWIGDAAEIKAKRVRKQKTDREDARLLLKLNQLQAVAMNEGYRWKKRLFSEKGRAQLEKLSWEALSNQQIGWCCADGLSRHD